MSQNDPEQLMAQAARALQDKRDMRRNPARRALREVMIQIDSIEPNIEAVKESLAVAMDKFGSEVLFIKDEHTRLSLKDVLEANKERAVAKPSVDYVTQVLSAEMKRENKHASEVVRRNRERSETLFKS